MIQMFSLVVAVWIAIVPAVAHHSFAMFDQQRTVALEGAVEEFRWTNPHCFVVLIVDGERWTVEMSAPKALRHLGFAPDILRPGMQVKVIIHPLRDGDGLRGGHFVRAVLPDGSEIGEIDPGGKLPGEWPPRPEP